MSENDDAFTDDTFRKAWRILIARVTDRVRDGFETELRYHKRRASFRPSNGSVDSETRFWK